MRVIALVSGGKDSCYNMVQCVAAKHEIVGLAHLKPPPAEYEEIDSQMFQTVGSSGVDYIAKAMQLPLYVQEISGTGKEVEKDYVPTEGDEVEDLYRLLKIAAKETDAQGVSVGAILSDYQRVRVENVCLRLNLTPLSYLWRRDQTELLDEMVSAGMECILIKVACLGLDQKCLTRTLGQMRDDLVKLSDKYGVHVCGEGGEYETYTLNSPLFVKKIEILESDVVEASSDPFAPVAFLQFKSIKLIDKPHLEGLTQRERLEKGRLPAIDPQVYINDVADLSTNDDPSGDLDFKFCTEYPDFSSDSFKWCCVVPDCPGMGWTEFLNIPGRGSDPHQAIVGAFTKLTDLVNSHTGSSNVNRLARIVLYVSRMSEYREINDVYVQNFGINPPVRVCVAVGEAKFPTGVQLVLSARLPPLNQDRICLHVQGISHWAPANIGPYSQGVKVGDEIHVSGQIGLVPGTMMLIDGGAGPEAALSLRHACRVIAAMINQTDIWAANVVFKEVVCYLTSVDYQVTVEKVFQKWWKGSDQQHNVKVVFQIVKELPRGAAVEWEIVAAQY